MLHNQKILSLQKLRQAHARTQNAKTVGHFLVETQRQERLSHESYIRISRIRSNVFISESLSTYNKNRYIRATM